MSVELSTSLKQRYPNLKLAEQGDKILSVCAVDSQRCLNRKDPEEDYGFSVFQAETIIRVFTAFAKNCTICERNISQEPLMEEAKKAISGLESVDGEAVLL